MFVNIICMFTEICLCTLHDLLLDITTYWGILLRIFIDLLFHCFYPHWTSSTIVDSKTLFWIYHLVVTCIETYILVPNLSIYHIFISILKSYLHYLLENIQFFMLSLWPQAAPTRGTNKNGRYYYFPYFR